MQHQDYNLNNIGGCSNNTSTMNVIDLNKESFTNQNFNINHQYNLSNFTNELNSSIQNQLMMNENVRLNEFTKKGN